MAALTIDVCDPARVNFVNQNTPAAETHEDTFGTSGSCRSCHPDAYATWSATYHRTMTQRASPESVVGDWEHVMLERNGREYYLYRENEAFWVDMPKHGTRGDTDAERMQRPIVMTTGSHHMQLYWYAVPWVDKEASRAGSAVFEASCTACHFSPWGEVKEPYERTFLENRQRTEPWLRNYLSEDPKTGPHQQVFGQLRASERTELLQFLTRIQHGDRLAQFPFAWFIRQQRWVHEEDSFLAPPEEPPELEEITEGWSQGCDRCHAVGGAFSWDPETQAGAAEVTDLGIACEACHGGGAAHASRYRDPLSRYAAHLGWTDPDDIIVPDKLPAERSAQVCGQCHAELVPKAGGDFPLNFEAGDDLSSVAHFLRYTNDRPEWLAEHLEEEPDALASGFWRDGTMRIAGRDYTALLETDCHTGGDLSCTTCHQMHGADPNDQLKPWAVGDSPAGEAVCVHCHSGFDTPSHHHHAEGSSGARCMNCHMPRTTIGLLTVMRSHRIDSPQPAQAGETGRPDACSMCHLDKPLSWSAQHASEWYGQDPLSYGVSSSAPAALDWLLRGDAAQRAVLAWHLGAPDTATGTSWTPVYLAWSIDDPYVAIRSIVHERLRTLPGYADLDWDPTTAPEDLQTVREAILTRWQRHQPGLDRPDVWIDNGVPRAGRIEQWRMLRDESPVSVNE